MQNSESVYCTEDFRPLARLSARRFLRERSGQSMLFTGLVIFVLVIMVGMIVGIGEISSDQMRLQNAADAAAYSAAAVQADCLAQIAWLNEGAAAIYYKALSQSVHNITTYTENSLGQAWWNPGASGVLPNLPLNNANLDMPLNPWMNGGKEWYEKIMKIERLIAVLAPILIKNQVYHTAHANYFLDKSSGVEKPLRIAIYPNPGNTDNPAWSFYPEGSGFNDAVLEHDPKDLGSATKGWRITSETDPGYRMEVLHTIIDDPRTGGVFNQWHILSDQPDTTDESGMTSTNVLDLWVDEMVFVPFKPVSAIGGAVYHKGALYQHGEFVLNVNGDIYRIDTYALAPGDEIVVTKLQTPDKTYLMEKVDENESYINGKRYRRNEDGSFTSGEETFSGSATINGQPVPVNFPAYLTEGDTNISFSWPLHLIINGKNGRGSLRVEVTNGLQLSYLFNWAIGWISANDLRATVKELSTLRPDVRWKSPPGAQGRIYHRLFEYPDEDDSTLKRYKYEIVNVGGYLQNMSLRKLGFRALMVNDSDSTLPAEFRNSGYVPYASVPRQYNDKGKLLSFSSDDYRWRTFQSSVWDLLATGGLLWACPPRTPSDGTRATTAGAFGGFIDLETGQLTNVDNTGDNKVDSGTSAYAFSLTGGNSPYGASLSGQFYSGQWRITQTIVSSTTLFASYNTGSAIVGESNPLWRFYQSLCRSETVDVSDIIIDGGNKQNCGFYVVGKAYSSYNDPELRDKITRIHQAWLDQGSPVFTVDKDISYNFPCFTYTEGTNILLAVWDPYGTLAAFRNQPKFPGELMNPFYAADSSSGGPDWSDFKAAIARSPTVIRRYAYHGTGINTKPEEADFLGYGMGIDIRDIKFENITALPLEATSLVFRNPVVVCVYKPEGVSWLSPLMGRSREKATEGQINRGLFNPLHVTDRSAPHKWSSGHFAFAAARVFVQPRPNSGYITNFAFCGNDYRDLGSRAGSMANAAMDFPNYVDAITQLYLSGYRQRWLASLHNLFEPNWTAALVPFEAALRVEDVQPASEYTDTSETATAFLLRSFNTAAEHHGRHHHSARDGWMKNSYEKLHTWSYEDQEANRSWRSITSPSLGDNEGRGVDWSAGQMSELLLH